LIKGNEAALNYKSGKGVAYKKAIKIKNPAKEKYIPKKRNEKFYGGGYSGI